MSQQQIEALNRAGETLKALGLGTVRLRYREGDNLIPGERFTFWIEGTPTSPDGIGVGSTPAEALDNARAELARKKRRTA